MSNIGIGVNFTGTENVNRTISSIKSGLNGLEREAKDVGDTSSGAFSKAKSGMEDLGRAVQNTGGAFTVLKGATSVFLGELATKITGLAIKAVKMLARELVELGKEMIKLGLESNASAKGMFDNFNTQVTNLKRLFGEELVSVIGPSLQGIADKISSLINSGQLQPLLDSFGSLFTSVWSCGMATGNLLLKITGVKDEKDAIETIANSFDRMRIIIDTVADALKRVEAIISRLHLDTVFNLISSGANPVGNAIWGWSGQQVAMEKASGMTDWEKMARQQALAAQDNSQATDLQTDTALDYINALINQQKTTQASTSIQNAFAAAAQNTSGRVGALGGAISGAISSINNALGKGTGGGSSGGSGCRTFQTGTSVEGGGTANGAVGGGGPSGSPGMLWYNVLGNENAAAVSAMGESWASTVSNVTRNSCSGQVCSFDADGQTFYGDGSGSFTSVNDALITNKGEVIQFHPDDNILAFKGNGPKGSTNVTINVNGAGDPERVAELILKKINTKVGMAW